jgi:hypothetical protein
MLSTGAVGGGRIKGFTGTKLCNWLLSKHLTRSAFCYNFPALFLPYHLLFIPLLFLNTPTNFIKVFPSSCLIITRIFSTPICILFLSICFHHNYACSSHQQSIALGDLMFRLSIACSFNGPQVIVQSESTNQVVTLKLINIFCV